MGRTSASVFATLLVASMFAFLVMVPAPVAADKGYVSITYSTPSSAILGMKGYSVGMSLYNNAYMSDSITIINLSVEVVNILDPDGTSIGLGSGPFIFTKKKTSTSDPDQRISFNSNSGTFYHIDFDMETSGRPGDYSLEIRMSYKYHESGSPDPPASGTDTDFVDIDVRSGVTVTKRVNIPGGKLYTGTDFKHVTVSITNTAGDEIAGVTATMDLKTRVPWASSKETYPYIALQAEKPDAMSTASSYISKMNSGETVQFNFRVTVKDDTVPGIYPGKVTVKFTREIDDEDVLIESQEMDVEFAVAFTPLLEISSPDKFTLSQGTSTYDLDDIEITNIGNADLLRLNFWIDIENYFEQNDFYYEGEGGGRVLKPEEKEVTSLPKNSKTGLSFKDVKLFKYLPPGEHRIRLEYDGYYYNDGTTDDSSGFIETDHNDYFIIKGQSLYMTIIVEDDAFDIVAESSNSITLGGSTKDIGITVSVTNNEAIDIMYASFSLAVKPTGQPSNLLVNPVSPNDDELEVIEQQWFLGLSTTTITFNADLSLNAQPGFYTLPLTVSGYNGNTKEALSSDIEVDVRIRVNPEPPRLEITDMQTTEIVPGEGFTLTLALTNTGGTRATDVSVRISDDQTEGGYGSGSTDFTPDVAFAESAIHPFSTEVSLQYVQDIDAGETVNVQFVMNASKQAVKGKYYEETVFVDCNDQYGRTFSDWSEVSMQVPGAAPKRPVPPPDYTPLLYPLAVGIILVVLIFVFMMVGMRSMRKQGGSSGGAGRTRFEEYEAETPVRSSAPEPAPAPAPEQEPYQRPQPAYASPPPQGPTRPAAGKSCPRCGKGVPSDAFVCPHCGCAV